MPTLRKQTPEEAQKSAETKALSEEIREAAKRQNLGTNPPVKNPINRKTINRFRVGKKKNPIPATEK